MNRFGNRFGIDASNNNGVIEWDEAAPHIAFALLKATEGTTFKDRYFARNVAGCRWCHIPFGPYHFATNESADAEIECDRFLDFAMHHGWGKKGDLPGILDIERGKGGRPGVRFVRRFGKRYRHRTGHRVMIYTGSFWRDVLLNPMTMTRCKLILAAYTKTWHGWIPRAWKKPWFWQFTESAHCPGINGPVDGDRFLRSHRSFEKMRLHQDI